MTVDSQEENVHVVVRCRPISEDNESQEEIAVKIDDSNHTIGVDSRIFAFDRVFGFESTQMEVYTLAAKQIVESVLQGYNGTIFAYGQTGTGKTFTSAGVLNHCFAHIFGFIAKSANDTQFLVRASYYEIYNEEIRDLLNKANTKPLELKESTQTGVYIKDLSCYVVNNVSELEKLKNLGEKNRAVAATNMNAHSSRSHTIFTMAIEMIKTKNESGDKGQGALRVGKLHLVDLAGSERQSKTGTTGDRLKEAAKINLSLTSLSLVIAALTDPKATHIPYRNSKLTRILSDSLGGNSKTLLIACIGPAKNNLDESISTLRFASTAKKIKNAARINEDPKDALLRKFQDQILELKKQLETAEEAAEEANQPDGQEAEKGDDGKAAPPVASVPAELMEKLKNLEHKIMVGGENLLEKAELQEKLLKESEAELQAIRDKEEKLKFELEKKQQEILQIEESYGTLQEEVTGLNKKLKKCFNYLTVAKSELGDTQSEYGQLREDLLDTIRATHKEIKLANFIISQHIPESYFDLIQGAAKYNEAVGEWQLKCIAYTGNNIQEQKLQAVEADIADEELDIQSAYLSYRH
ncbi:Kinesin-like protein KIF3A [Halotydeus destructor]|nr:Kinesin-like protein KIF3A [Halotydeus destructor]